jgi:multiple sugar transport system substrate-binding protein
MRQLEFSVMGNDSNPDLTNNIRPLLQAFEEQYHIHVNLISIPWATGWTEISKFGIYGHGPDVSEIGTTWIGSLAAMQTLRPFTLQEVQGVGGPTAFFESSWRSGFLSGVNQPYAIPWLGDLLVLYYWKDILEKAGVSDPKTAFAGHEAFVKTLEKLQAHGNPYPLSLTTVRQTRNLHEAAGWIWGAGGDLLSPDHQKIFFHEAEAMNGWRKYFSLHRFISPKTLNQANSGELFSSGEAAVAITGSWQGIVGRKLHPEWENRLGIAPVPETAYVGGSSFIIWQYSRNAAEAFELVRFLAMQPSRIPGSPHSDELPVRRDAIYIPSVEKDEFYRTYLEVLQVGRNFPTVRLWGMLEDKLTQTINNVWAEIFANPSLDLDECLHRHFVPLAQRLNNAMGN